MTSPAFDSASALLTELADLAATASPEELSSAASSTPPTSSSLPEIEQRMANILAFVRSGEIRDFEPDGLFDDVRLYSRLSSLLERLFTEVIEEPELPLITDDDNPHDVFKEASVAASERGRAKLLGQYVRLLQTFFALPEVVERCTAQASGAADASTTNIVALAFDPRFFLQLVRRFHASSPPAAALVPLLHAGYSCLVPHRAAIRAAMAEFLHTYVMRRSIDPRGVSEVLQVLSCVVRGFKPHTDPTNNLAEHRKLLRRVVLPLHRVDHKLNGLTATMSIYHDVLVFTLVSYLEKDPEFFPETIQAVLRAWPHVRNANSPKVVLLLHELDKLMEFADVAPGTLDMVLRPLLSCLAHACASLHHVIAERALLLFSNHLFTSLITETEARRRIVYPIMFPVMMGEKSWNKTVNKMRVSLLRLLMSRDLQLFTRMSNTHWGSPGSLHKTEAAMLELSPPAEEEEKTLFELQETGPAASKPAPLSNDLTLSVEREASSGASGKPLSYFEFVFGHQLGEGAFSRVRYAKRIVRGTMPSKWPEYAMKIMDKSLLEHQEYGANVRNEVSIMRELSSRRHPNVNQLLGVCESDLHVYLVLEYAAQGDLHNHISKLGSLDLDTTRFVVAELVLALEEVHSLGIVFGDLKPENVLVHKNGHIKLGDFGSARREADIKASDRMEGTAEYVALEVLQGGCASRASDLWALGCVLYQCLAGRTPVWAEEAEGNEDVFRKIVSFSEDRHFPPDFDEAARDLVNQLMHADPALRLGAPLSDGGFEALKAHPFFSSIDFAAVNQEPAPRFGEGAVAPAPDQAWSRRKWSMMQAPLPQEFNFDAAQFRLPVIDELDGEEQIPESFFSHKAQSRDLPSVAEERLDAAPASGRPPRPPAANVRLDGRNVQAGNPYAIGHPSAQRPSSRAAAELTKRVFKKRQNKS